jgi:alkanesulfonate monooxygenase SsuD/methylene tetrahydromethanopterin reductase-like flavin-dependent oxidoreductase (luciferase family)
MQAIAPNLRASLERELAFTAIGTREDVRSTMMEFIEYTGADELMIDDRIFEPAARRKSYEIAAQALADEVD